MKEKHSYIGILTTTSLSTFLVPFIGSALNVAMPSLGKDLSLTAPQLGWVVSAYLLPTAALLIPMGRIADLTGRRRLFFSGTLLFTIASLLSALAPNAALFFLSRILHGVGASMIFANSAAILTASVPPSHRGGALGINTATVYIGMSIGPFLGGLMTSLVSWRLIFFTTALIGATTLFLILRYVAKDSERPPLERSSFNLSGITFYASTVLLFLGGTGLLPSRKGFLLLAASLVVLFFFSRIEKRASLPLWESSLLKENRLFVFSNLTALIHYASIWSSSFLLALYLQFVRGLSPEVTGLILLSQPIIMFFLSPITGHLSDRIEPRLLSSSGMVLTTLSLASLIPLSAHTPAYWVVGSLILMGIGYGLFCSPNTNAIMGSVEERHYGLASASLATMRMLGQSLSMSLSTVVLAMVVGHKPLSSSTNTLLLKAAFWVFLIQTLLAALGIFTSLARGKMYNRT